MAVLGISLITSCAKETKDPVLNIDQTVLPGLTTPADGASFVLVKGTGDSVMTEFIWTPSAYNLTNVENTKYMVEMDLAGNNFADPYVITSTQSTSASITVGKMNNLMLSVLELSPEVPQAFEIRVNSFINQVSEYSSVYSPVITITVTPYDEAIYIKPIYMLGDATEAGWDNTLAVPIPHIGNGKFAGVQTLNATGAWIKFISVLGAWAPQWGTDAAGTSTSGNLVYRPDEQTTDPASIPSPMVAGDYYFLADTVNLTYEIYPTSGNLFLVGDATPAGWDAGAAIQFTQSSPHVFTLTTNLNATGGMKFLEVQGAWAPQYGTNDKGTNKKGLLVYRPTESVPDPPSIPAPSAAGSYLITVDLNTMLYSIEPQ
jgi:starch-binding outer membrane protein SusE/F